MVANRGSIRVAAMQMSALLRGPFKEMLGSFAAISAASLPCFALGTLIRQNQLAACKTLASKQNISEGYGAKLDQTRAFPKSLLFIEEPAQFHANTASAEDGSPFLQVPPHARQQEAPKGQPPGLKGSNAVAAHGPSSSSTEARGVCVGQPEPGLRGRRLRRGQFGCAAEG